MKNCPKCGEQKPLSDFTRNKTTRDGLSVYCRPCVKINNRLVTIQRRERLGVKRPNSIFQKLPAIDRFHTRYEVEPGGCWIWTGAVAGGYGTITTELGMENAHRFSYRHHHGPIPDGMFVCHRCDVRLCVNPAHLFVGTAKDNAQDCVNKGRQSKGERHSLAIRAALAKRQAA